MKKYLTLLLIAMMGIISCQKFDYSEIWDKLNNHETRLAYLEEVCKNMNTSIINLQAIVTALETNDCIISASPLVTGDGYTFLFKSGKSVVIYNGKDGEDGKDGYTPIIGVKQDSDGVYYWTLDGDWLLDSSGNQVPTTGANGTEGKNGKDGITPQLKIEDGFWYLSYNNGESWQKLGKATGDNGEDGDSIIDSITQDEDNVYFNLTNGQVLIIPKRIEKVIDFADFNVMVICLDNWDTDNDGEISYQEAASVTSLSGVFSCNEDIVLFNELKYFTGLKEIGEYEFAACSSLRNVTLPENITKIDKNAFQGTNIASIKIPKSVHTIESWAFYNCKRLSTLEFETGSQLLYIKGSNQYGAFAKCQIKSVRIPASVIEIGQGAFFYNVLTEVIFEENSQLMYLYGGYDTSGYVNFPYKPYGAFALNSDLKKIVLPANLQVMGDFMFENIEEVYVTSTYPCKIGTMTFYTSSSNNAATTVPAMLNASRSSTVKIYVPNGFEDEYKSTSGWSSYKNQIYGYDYDTNPIQ